jgi:hypothetical protein
MYNVYNKDYIYNKMYSNFVLITQNKTEREGRKKE